MLLDLLKRVRGTLFDAVVLNSFYPMDKFNNIVVDKLVNVITVNCV